MKFIRHRDHAHFGRVPVYRVPAWGVYYLFSPLQGELVLEYEVLMKDGLWFRAAAHVGDVTAKVTVQLVKLAIVDAYLVRHT